ncbi:MAG: thrombospondin type 3 repeat-containing protein, partial [Candidatus Hodarchaeota archaeon]
MTRRCNNHKKLLWIYAGIIILVMIGTAPATAYTISHQTIDALDIVKAFSSPNHVEILYDSTSPTAQKAEVVLTSLLTGAVKVSSTSINTPEALCTRLSQLDRNTIVAYGFHGDEKGMKMGEASLAWQKVASFVDKSSPEHHAILSCDSDRIPKITKSVLAQKGEIDYVMASLRTAGYIARVLNEPALWGRLIQRVDESRVGLTCRLVQPIETMWQESTHYSMISIALTRLYQIPWVDAALKSAGYPGANDRVNPDVEDDNTALSDPTLLMEALTHKDEPTWRQKLDEALFHVSFGAEVSIYLKVPRDTLEDQLGKTNADLYDPDGDGIISISANEYGKSKDRFFYCFDQARMCDPIKDSTNKFQYAIWLSRAAHYIQDQQVPFHTALANKENNPVAVLEIDESFDARKVFVKKAVDNGVPQILAEYVYDGQPNELLAGAIGIGTLVVIIIAAGAIIGGWIGAILGGLFGIVFADLWAKGLKQAGIDAAAEGQAIADRIMAIVDNNEQWYDKHTRFESYYRNEMDSSTKTMYLDIQSYLGSLSDSQLIAEADALLGPNRDTYFEDKVEESRIWAASAYSQTLSSSKSLAKLRLKKATLLTAATYLAYYNERFRDSDGDGFSDYIEINVFGSNPNSASRWMTVSVRGLTFLGFGTYLVRVSAYNGRPAKSVTFSFSWARSRRAYAYLYRQNTISKYYILVLEDATYLSV